MTVPGNELQNYTEFNMTDIYFTT